MGRDKERERAKVTTSQFHVRVVMSNRYVTEKKTDNLVGEDPGSVQ